jgi:hypothetical protein
MGPDWRAGLRPHRCLPGDFTSETENHKVTEKTDFAVNSESMGHKVSAGPLFSNFSSSFV